MQDLAASHEAAYLLINNGLSAKTLRTHLLSTASTASSAPAAQIEALTLRAAQRFQTAGTMADTLGDDRAASYAWGYLGGLYEEEQRYQEALQLTRRARSASQRIQAPESLYRWQWQTGRLLEAQGQIDEAIVAYRHAVQTLQSFRQEMLRGIGNSALTSFRESVGKVYFGLVDLLLQRSDVLTGRDNGMTHLTEARDTVEIFKAAELQDYFRDECVEAAQAGATRIETMVSSTTTAVVYPIPLPDRTELLVNLPSGLKRYVVPIDAQTLTQEVRAFRRKLEKRTTRQYLRHAQQLYEWLIRPLEADLGAASIETLVFVPDGPLRTIPMAALYDQDGQQFLINKYALAITPGLTLTDPRPLQRENLHVLVAGLTDAVQGFPSLPYVATEIQELQQIHPGAQLMNQNFQIAGLEQRLRDTPASVLHIASHGQFAGNVDDTFLLTFDEKLTLDRLEQLIGGLRFRDEPLEMITLSACQTAAGDDRAALGLAGVAVKAGARSALASLWYINDQAAAELMIEFYDQLRDPSVSRAAALQRAQLRLLADEDFQHPSFWSPFLMINNWL